MVDSKAFFKKDKRGKIRVQVLTVDADVIITSTSLLGGAVKRNERVINPSKTLSGSDRAATVYHKKIRDLTHAGWKATIEEAEESVEIVRKLMRPSNVEGNEDKIKYPCIVQPKLNGVRARCIGGKFYTRNNKEMIPFKHLKDNLPPLRPMHLDGELYCHGMSLQQISSASKKVSPETEKLEYYIFDVVGDGYDEDYRQRVRLLCDSNALDNPPIHRIKTHIATDYDSVVELFDRYVADGYEGIVIKNLDGKYEWDTYVLHQFKMKPVHSDEFVIKEVTFERRAGRELIEFICYTRAGDKAFKVIPDWTVDERSAAFTEHLNDGERFITKLLTVEYRDLSDDGVPMHAVGKVIRDREEL